MESSDSISDYMNNLLAKYSNKAAPKSDVAAPVPTVSVEKPATAPASPQPIRKSRSLEPGAIPKPVHTCDAKTTRTQMELLRETSNLTAALAIRTASARRRRQNLMRLLMLTAAAAVVYAIFLVIG